MKSRSSQSQNSLGESAKKPKFGRLGAAIRWAFLSSLTRRIIFLNLAGLAVFVIGIFYLNQFREGLIDARVESLHTQAEIIASAIAAQATVETGAITVDPELLLELEAGDGDLPSLDSLSSLESGIDPENVAPVLKRLTSATRTRARIFDVDALLLLDSASIYSSGQVLSVSLPKLPVEEPSLTKRMTVWFNSLWASIFGTGLDSQNLDIAAGEADVADEVAKALNGVATISLKKNQQGGSVVSVAVPIQRFRAVLGVLLLSTQGSDIDEIVRSERLAIGRVFLVAVGVTIFLSLILASTIASPLYRLSEAALRVRRSVKARSQIPDLSDRGDEVGELSLSLRNMTSALYARIDAIESFAADVSHELKNPLTSLRSAVETLPLAKNNEMRGRLMDVIQHDVKRLDRLITDISDASRLDAEMARLDAAPLDLLRFLDDIVKANQDERSGRKPMSLSLSVEEGEGSKNKGRQPSKSDTLFYVSAHDSRLGQVFRNIIDNARSFVDENGKLDINLMRLGKQVIIHFDDNGPGIGAQNIERIFERFYTDRPDENAFGQNSGLGLAISRQIIEAHGGTLTAENLLDEEDGILGARFTVVLPASDEREILGNSKS